MESEFVKINMLKLDPIWETKTLSGWHSLSNISCAKKAETNMYRLDYTHGPLPEQKYETGESLILVRNILTGRVIEYKIVEFYEKRFGKTE